MTSVNSWYPDPVVMDGDGLEWGPIQWADAGTFSDADHPDPAENERRFYTIAVRRGRGENTDAASIAVLGVTRDLEIGLEMRYRADSEDWTPCDRDGIPPSVCKRAPADSGIPTARKEKFRRVLERAHDLEDSTVDARLEDANELRADGGVSEAEQVDRAVREAATLIDAGDSTTVAVEYVVAEHDLEHRRDDVHQRVRERLEQVVVTDGGQCSSGTEQTFRYEADGKIVELRPGDRWKTRSRSGSGWYTRKYRVRSVGPDGIHYTLSFEGNFLNRQHDDATLFGTDPVEKGDARYVDTDTEPLTDGGHPSDELVVLECEPCDYQTVVARGTMSMTSCPDCQGDLEVDHTRVAHQCPDPTANHVIVEANERCPFCQTIQKRVATDGGVDQDDEYFVVDESRATVVAGPFDAKEPAAADARERGPNHIVTTEGSLELIALTSDTSIRWENDDADIATDGGRQTFLNGDAHWCDICETKFESLGELIRHDCQDERAIADGGHPQHRANCEDCPWSYRDTDLVDVSDEMERHARKEMHDVDLERAVATDGGHCVDDTERRYWVEYTQDAGWGGRTEKTFTTVECSSVEVSNGLARFIDGSGMDVFTIRADRVIEYGGRSRDTGSVRENSTGTEGGDSR